MRWEDDMADRTVRVVDLFSSETIGAGGTITSSPVDLRERAKNGNLSLEYLITSDGSPTVDVTYQLSYDAVNWVDGSSTLKDGLAKGDGRTIQDITSDIELSPWIRFKMTEDASDASGAVATMRLAVQ
jgi:hypothetical protein